MAAVPSRVDVYVQSRVSVVMSRTGPRGPAGPESAEAIAIARAEADRSEQAANDATQSATEAAQSATDSQASADSSATAAAESQASADAAAASESNAEQFAIAAAASADSAATSATEAQNVLTEVTNAGNVAISGAEDAATRAASSATAADGSAQAAAASATAAKSSETIAASGAASASTSASQAAASATGAATSATQAGSSATAAAASATAAQDTLTQTIAVAESVGLEGAAVNEIGHLIVTRGDSTAYDAGYVVGPQGDPGPPGAVSPIPGAYGEIQFAEDGPGTETVLGATSRLTVNRASGVLSIDSGLMVGANSALGWTSTPAATPGSTPDLTIVRDGPDVLAMRRGTNPQSLRVFNTYIDPSNYEFGSLRFAGNALQLGTWNGGTGVARALQLVTNGATRWQLDAAGNLAPTSDVLYDIGSSSFKVRTVYLASMVVPVLSGNHVIDVRNSTNPQTLRVYNTYTDASNHERLNVNFSGNTAYVATDQAGTGVARPLVLGTLGSAAVSLITVGSQRWQVPATGHFVPGLDNTYDIGSSSLQVRALYASSIVNGSNPVLTPGGAAQPPTFTTRSTGTRLVLNPSLSGVQVDSAVGYGSSGPWFSTPAAGGSFLFTWYGGTTVAATLDGLGSLTLTGAVFTMGTTGNGRVATRDNLDGFTSGYNVYNVAGTAKAVAAGNYSGTYKRTTALYDVFVGNAAAAGDNLLPQLSIAAAITVLSTNVFEQRNGVTAQAFRIFNTYTDASNYERGFAQWTSNVFEFGTLHAGTGVARALRLRTSGTVSIYFNINSTDRWEIAGSGAHFLPSTDNNTDIGSVTNRVRAIYIGTGGIQMGSTQAYGGVDGVGVFSLRHPTYAQSLRVYSAYTDGSNNEYVNIGFGGTNRVIISPAANGTGVLRELEFGYVTTPKSSLVSGGLLSLTPNVLEQINSTIAQTFRIYSTYTDPSNYERLQFLNSAGRWWIESAPLGTGSISELVFRGFRLVFWTGATGATAQHWYMENNGNFLASVDNTVDIGQSAGLRPRAIYAGTRIDTPLLGSGADLAVNVGGNINIMSGGVSVKWQFDTTGRFVPFADNTYDIGSTALRPRNLYIANSVYVNNAGAALQGNPGVFVKGYSGDNNWGGNIQLESFNGTTVKWNILASTAGIQFQNQGVTRFVIDPSTFAELRNGTTAQSFRVYNTYTDAANYERAELSWASGIATLSTTNAGTGSARQLFIRAAANLSIGSNGNSQIYVYTNGATRWMFAESSQGYAFMPYNADNTYDIGNAANRVRTLYVGTSIVAPGITPPAGVPLALIAPAGQELTLGSGGAADWKIDVNGHLTPVVNNTYDLGATALQPRSLYAAASLVLNTNTILVPDANNILGLRNGTNAQTFKVYGTYTDASNNEYMQYSSTGVTARATGTGVQSSLTLDAAQIVFRTAATSRWVMDASGNLLGSSGDGLYNIGGSANNRPLNVYATSSIRADDSVLSGNAGQIGFTSVPGSGSGVADCVFVRDAANVMALRRTTNAQQFKIYRTYTDASNYSRLGILNDATYGWRFQSEQLGTGPQSSISLSGYRVHIWVGPSQTLSWRWESTGALQPEADNTYDIGNSGVRIRNFYAAGARIGAYVGAAHALSVAGGGARFYQISAPVNVTVTPQGTAGTTAYSYYVVAKDPNGNKTTISLVGSTATGAAVLNATDFNRITWTTVAGAASYDVLKGNTTTSIAVGITTNSYDDVGGSTAAYTAPTRNATGDVTVDGNVSGNFINTGDYITINGASSVPVNTPSSGIWFLGSGVRHGSLSFMPNEKEFLFHGGANPDTISPDSYGSGNIALRLAGAGSGSFRTYNTYTDLSNYDRASLSISGNYAVLQTEALGTGAARHLAIRTPASTSIYIGAGGSDKWIFVNGGAIQPAADNTYDLGVSVSNRVRVVYVGTGISTPSLYSPAGTDLAVTAGTGNVLNLGANGVNRWKIDATAALLPLANGTQDFGSASLQIQNIYPAGSVRFGNITSFISWASTVTLVPDASNALTIRNGNQPQTFRVYGTYTDASNYERGTFQWASSVFRVGVEAAGTGVERALALKATSIIVGTNTVDTFNFNINGLFPLTDNTYSLGSANQFTGVFTRMVSSAVALIISSGGAQRWQFDATGHIVPMLDNTYNIGSATMRVATGNFINLSVVQSTLVNGVNPTASYIYNTYTDASNYERASLLWSSNVFRIGTEAAGTGTQRNLTLSTGSSITFLANAAVDTKAVFTLSASSASMDLYRIPGTNYEAIRVGSVGGGFLLQSMQGGTGVARTLDVGTTGAANLIFTTNGSQRWTVDATLAHFCPTNDNVYDIGANALRPRSIYASTSVILPAGTKTTPSLKMGAGNVYARSGTQLAWSDGANELGYLGTSGILLASTYTVGFSAGSPDVSSADVALYRGAAGALDLRVGANPQAFRVYNTYTDASNYERAVIWWNSNIVSFGSEAGGTGVLRGTQIQGQVIRIVTGGGTLRWYFDSTGHFYPQVDATYDFGIASQRIRNIYGSGNLYMDNAAANCSVIIGKAGNTNTYGNSLIIYSGYHATAYSHILTQFYAGCQHNFQSTLHFSNTVNNSWIGYLTQGELRLTNRTPALMVADYEYGGFLWSSDEFRVQTGTAGTGVPRDLVLTTPAGAATRITSGTAKITANGTANLWVQTLTRTIPIVVGDEVDIGQINASNGALVLDIWLLIPSSAFSVAKKYTVSCLYNGNLNTWQRLQPVTDTDPFGGASDVDLDIKINASLIDLRLRRTLGTNAGTAFITLMFLSNIGTFTESTLTSTVTPPTVTWHGSIPKVPQCTVAALPPVSSWHRGIEVGVTDSTVAAAGNYGNVVAGGGANYVKVYCDGSAWRIG